MSAATALSEAELHGLVDNCLDADRRTDVLRRAAHFPADRQRVERWQDQNDLIRAAFEGIDAEPLPTGLDLRPPPRLQSVPTLPKPAVQALRLQAAAMAIPPIPDPSVKARGHAAGRWRDAANMVTCAAVVVGGLFGSWILIQPVQDRDESGVPSLRGSIDETLANRTALALAETRPSLPPTRTAVVGLPTTAIPDLTPAGFTFTGAETRLDAPVLLVFHYRNAAADHVVVAVARAPNLQPTAPRRVGGALNWRHGANAYAVAGTIPDQRLAAVAATVRAGEVDE